MTPTHATKKTKRYRYYVSVSLLACPQAQKEMHVTAGDMEGLVVSWAEAGHASGPHAIRAELAQSPSVALAAVVHALTLKVFYQGGSTCLEISTRLNSLKSVIRNADDSKARE
jgi:hypothetical protein